MRSKYHLLTQATLLVLLIAAVNTIVLALPAIEELITNQEQLDIVVKKSFLVRLNQNAERVSVVAPDIADVQIIDPQQILITGNAVGETSLIIWTEDGNTRMININVKWNTAPIKQSIQHMLPNEAIEVVPMENGVALRGQASSIEAVDQALEISQQFAPNVVNMLDVPGRYQVLLKVKIAEVASSFRKEAGFNFLINNKDFVGGSTIGNLISGSLTGQGDVEMSDAVTLFFGLPNSDVAGFIQALKQRGWIHVLAQPNLIARSGETASFLAGGEFPIPVAQGGAFANSITIEYKEFGVRLRFTPTVLDNKTIHLDINPEVSDLDFSQGLQLSGFVIPTVITRRAQTVVQLRDGQTFAIAGLLSNIRQKISRKVPIVGEVPFFGTLFSSKEINERETELLIMVTPHLIAPLEDGEKYSMPQPDDWENQQVILPIVEEVPAVEVVPIQGQALPPENESIEPTYKPYVPKPKRK